VGLTSLEEFLGFGYLDCCHLVSFRVSNFDIRI